MTVLRRLFYYYLGVVLAAAVFLAAIKKLGLLSGFILGIAIALMNFLLLQRSVKSMTASAAGAAQPQFANAAFKYFITSFLKLTITAVLFFVFVVFLKVHWLGLLAGLFGGMLIYTMELLRNKK